MKFVSLSEAILHYSGSQSSGTNYAPYGSLAAETGQMPLNTNYLTPDPANVIRYGVTIWGQNKIIEISKPTI